MDAHASEAVNVVNFSRNDTIQQDRSPILIRPGDSTYFVDLGGSK